MGSGGANFKNTFEEKPSDKSWLTTFFRISKNMVIQAPIIFFQVHLTNWWAIAYYIRLASNSLMEYKLGFQIFGILFLGEAFFNQFIKECFWKILLSTSE